MYVRRLSIRNIRSIAALDIELTEEECPGWHVLIGNNGSGKSSVVRSLALGLVGQPEAPATRSSWSEWIRHHSDAAKISIQIFRDALYDESFLSRRSVSNVELLITRSRLNTRRRLAELSSPPGSLRGDELWAGNRGWFSASFGPFRRFAGGDKEYDRLFETHPRLAPHLSAFGEDVALNQGLEWLQHLHIKHLENGEQEGRLLEKLIDLLNSSDLLPHGARIKTVRSDEIVMEDGDGAKVAVEQMSDGYRSVLSMVFEILRQMSVAYGLERLIEAVDVQEGAIHLPGVVAIDEVDAHLHPSWQRDIGPWFLRVFPKLQFFVTTHSPIICRAATSVWRLATPGTDEDNRRITGAELDRLIYGSILDAYGTEAFGRHVERSEQSADMLRRLSLLNKKAVDGADLTEEERAEMQRLRSALPSRSATQSA